MSVLIVCIDHLASIFRLFDHNQDTQRWLPVAQAISLETAAFLMSMITYLLPHHETFWPRLGANISLLFIAAGNAVALFMSAPDQPWPLTVGAAVLVPFLTLVLSKSIAVLAKRLQPQPPVRTQPLRAAASPPVTSPTKHVALHGAVPEAPAADALHENPIARERVASHEAVPDAPAADAFHENPIAPGRAARPRAATGHGTVPAAHPIPMDGAEAPPRPPRSPDRPATPPTPLQTDGAVGTAAPEADALDTDPLPSPDPTSTPMVAPAPSGQAQASPRSPARRRPPNPKSSQGATAGNTERDMQQRILECLTSGPVPRRQLYLAAAGARSLVDEQIDQLCSSGRITVTGRLYQLCAPSADAAAAAGPGTAAAATSDP